MPTIEYQAPGAVIDAFLISDAFVRGIRGPFGSGKSTACVMDILTRASQQKVGADGKRHSRWAVIRNTYPELTTTTIKTWHQWVPQTLGKWVSQGPPAHHIMTGDIDLEVWFLALDRPDDVDKLLSMELTGAWMNEAREIPKAVLDGLTGRVGRYPSAMMGGPSWFGVIMDTNPPDTDHWWYKLAEEEHPPEFEFFSQPSGVSPYAENAKNLPERYYERLMSGKKAEWNKVYVHGEYGFVSDGKLVYPEYSDGIHCRPFELNAGLPLTIGIDFGLTPAAAICQRDVSGRWLVRAELVSKSMGAKEFGAELARLLRSKYAAWPIGGIWGDPAGNQQAQTDKSTPFDMLASEGVNASPAPTNDFTLRREAVAHSLSRLIDGEPGMLIHPDCATLRKAMMGGYCYRRVQVSGEERFRDMPDKTAYSHVADACQYALVGAGEGDIVLRRRVPEPPRRLDRRRIAAFN